jgi:hypothetical protein
MTERGTTERSGSSDWTLMNALHDAFRRDLDNLLATSAGRRAVRARWAVFRDQLGYARGKSLMNVFAAREKLRFVSGGTECAAWHYLGTTGACVIMAGGGGVAKEPGTDLFTERFNGPATAAGAAGR